MYARCNWLQVFDRRFLQTQNNEAIARNMRTIVSISRPVNQAKIRHDIVKYPFREYTVAIPNSSPEVHVKDALELEKELTLEYIDNDGAKIAVMQMNRPAAKNSTSKNMLKRFLESLGQVRYDKSVRVVVIRSSVPGIFCAGTDLKELVKMSLSEVRQFVAKIGAMFTKIENLPMPVIAAIDGAAFGGGLEIPLACDLIVASSSAKMGLTEAKFAIIPGCGGSQRLPRIVGLAKAKELMYTGKVFDGAEANKIGLVSRVVDQNKDGDAAYHKAIELAEEILPNGPVGVRMAKISIGRGLQVDLATGLAIEEACYAQVIPTKDRQEGLSAFREKRLPRYTGE